MTLPLRKPTEKWTAEMDDLMEHAVDADWLRRKTDRDRRLREMGEYIDKVFWGLSEEESGICIDIGCGPGELLEICRKMGHDHVGVDSPNGLGGMGADYVRYSALMHERQRLHVDHRGLWEWLEKWGYNDVAYRGRCVLVNSRGSIEQCFADYMEGPPSHIVADWRARSWSVGGDCVQRFEMLFNAVWALLRPGGRFVVHANGSANEEFYDEVVTRNAEVIGLREVMKEGHTFHVWEKPCES